MIVTDDHVRTALDYLNDDPHPMAVARKRATDAENDRKERYARAYLFADGASETRKAQAEVDPEYIESKKKEADAVMELERHRACIKSAEMIIEVWRTENANARAAERVR